MKKDITLEALDKINYFIEEKKIDIYEKDKLLLKYSKLLEHYNATDFKTTTLCRIARDL